METYEQLLKKAYEKVKVVERGSERFEVPKVEGQVMGNNTVITNISPIANYLRRPVEHLTKFLQKELAVYVKLENGRLILKTKMNSFIVNEKIDKYTREFVICNECKKPDTEIISEKGVKYKHCLACGAKSPVRYNL
ncbi:MAG: translation initiation factor IF-2 subunit beta [Nanoarchaeota archaeon]